MAALRGHSSVPVAETKVMRFEKEIAIVIERYDR
jgi:hypothetical protein